MNSVSNNTARWVSVLIAVTALATAGSFLVAGRAASTVAEPGTPEVLNVRVDYKYSTLIGAPTYAITASGTVFIPAKTRVRLEYTRTGSSSNIYVYDYGPYHTGRTHAWSQSFTRDKTWTGKTFEVTLIASSTDGASSRSASVVLRPR